MEAVRFRKESFYSIILVVLIKKTWECNVDFVLCRCVAVEVPQSPTEWTGNGKGERK